MKQLPTAEELMTNVANEHSYETWGEMMYDTHEHSQIEYTREAMIEFAKLHVEAALESAVENGKVRLANDWVRKQETIHPNSLVGSITIKLDKQSILNAYPLVNIK